MISNIKIDLHLHSPASKDNGDGIEWESDYHTIKQLKNHNVQIAAFSDHNVFDWKHYQSLKQLAATAQILVLPAIEINVVRTDGQIANLIVIFSETLKTEELQTISAIAQKELPKRGISLARAETIFAEFATIRIPHVGKSDHFKWVDLQQITYDAIEITNAKHPNYQSVLKKEVKTAIVAFSDTHIWDHYPQQDKLITIIDQMETLSFAALKMALARKEDFTVKRF